VSDVREIVTALGELTLQVRRVAYVLEQQFQRRAAGSSAAFRTCRRCDCSIVSSNRLDTPQTQGRCPVCGEEVTHVEGSGSSVGGPPA
jgi:uncharacterized paraquat-inducible protein A